MSTPQPQPQPQPFPITLPSLTTTEAISDCIHRAVQGIDLNDLSLWESAWTKNRSEAFTEMIDGPSLTGLDQINQFVFERVGPLDTLHQISNIRVQHKEGEEKAEVTNYAVAWHFPKGEGAKTEGGRKLVSGGMYYLDVEWDGEDGVWRTRKWRARILWREGGAEVVA
jgi:hypothetical protein